jgi:hypothetical protein
LTRLLARRSARWLRTILLLSTGARIALKQPLAAQASTSSCFSHWAQVLLDRIIAQEPSLARSASDCSADNAFTMPARQRERYSTTPRSVITFSMESCSRRAGIRVHVDVETPFTMSRNTQPLDNAASSLAAPAAMRAQNACLASR